MPTELQSLLSQTDTLVNQAQGAVLSAAKDIRKEILYLAQELNIAGSADDREAVFAKVSGVLNKLGKRLDGLFAYNAQVAAKNAQKSASEATGVEVKISKAHTDAIVSALGGIGGKGLAATMTGAMDKNIVSALRDATVSAFREQALNGLTMAELEKVLAQKWEAAAKEPKNLQFVDKSGRLWDTRTYINMQTRTNAMRVYNDTLIQSLVKATGSDLVMVSKGGDPLCSLCFPWEGKILSATGKTKGFPTYEEARAAGCFHPNCVHTLEPVDEDFDRDEIALQKAFPFNPNATARELDEQRYQTDIAREMEQNGLSATEAKIAVDRKNLTDHIRHGLIREDAADIVAGLTDAQVNALCPNGNPPRFIAAKDGDGGTGWNVGKAGGVLYVGRNKLTTEGLVEMSGVGEGKPVKNVEPPKKSFVADTSKRGKTLAAIGEVETGLKEVVAACHANENALGAAKDKAAALVAEAGYPWHLFAAPFSVAIGYAQKGAKTADAYLHNATTWAGFVRDLKEPTNADGQKAFDFQCDAALEGIKDGKNFIKGDKGLKSPDALLAETEAAIKEKQAEQLKTLKNDAANYVAAVQAARGERLSCVKVIDALVATANLEKRKQYAELTDFRRYAYYLQKAEVELTRRVADFTSKAEAGDLTAIRAFSDCASYFADIGVDGTGFNDYAAAMKAAFERCKTFLEGRAGASGEQAVKEQTAAQEAKDAPLTAYAFPKDVTEKMLSGGKSLGGTTGAKLITLDVDGEKRQYIMKRGGNTSNAHLQNEMDANAAYRAAGVRVPDFKTYQLGKETVSLSEFIPNCVTLGEYLRTASEKDKARVISQLQKGFALDALFANHDVLGTGGDNVLVDKDGNAWRIDNGSAFGFRAQGGKKKPELFEEREYLDDLWSMRNDSLAPMRGVFSKMTTTGILRDAASIDLDAVEKALPDGIRAKLATPLRELRDLRDTCAAYDAGGYADDENEQAIQITHDFAKTGIAKKLDAIEEVADPTDVPDIYRRSVGEESTKVKAAAVNPFASEMASIISACKTCATHKDDKQFNKTTLATAHTALEKLQKEVKKVEAATQTGTAAEKKAATENLQTLNDFITTMQGIEKFVKAGKGVPYIPMLSAEWQNAPAPAPKKAAKTDERDGWSITKRLKDFVCQGDVSRWKLMTEWQSGQAGSSWDKDACRAKILSMTLNGLKANPTNAAKETLGPYSVYKGKGGEIYGVGGGGYENYKKAWDTYQADKEAFKKDLETFRRYRTATQYIMRHAKVKGLKVEGDTFVCCRTEAAASRLGLNAKGDTKILQRGACESTGLVWNGFGSEMTCQRVPISRINASCLMGRDVRHATMFFSDSENELTVDLSGLETPVLYLGRFAGHKNLGEARRQFEEWEKKHGLAK